MVAFKEKSVQNPQTRIFWGVSGGGGVVEGARFWDPGRAGTLGNGPRIATFVQQLINHCPDLLNLPTLCGSSATGLVSAASQIATWGSQARASSEMKGRTLDAGGSSPFFVEGRPLGGF